MNVSDRTALALGRDMLAQGDLLSLIVPAVLDWHGRTGTCDACGDGLAEGSEVTVCAETDGGVLVFRALHSGCAAVERDALGYREVAAPN